MESQMLCKFPPDVSKELRDALAHKELPDMGIRAKSGKDVVLDFDGRVFHATPGDLPCVVESMKTFNTETYYKSGDISTLLEFTEVKDSQEKAELMESTKPEEKQDDANVEEQKEKPKSGPAANKNPSFLAETALQPTPLDSGLTPPAHGVRTDWKQRSKVCECPGQDDYVCKKCNGFPKHKVQEVGEWMFSCLQQKPSEKFELIEIDEWEEDDPAGATSGTSTRATTGIFRSGGTGPGSARPASMTRNRPPSGGPFRRPPSGQRLRPPSGQRVIRRNTSPRRRLSPAGFATTRPPGRNGPGSQLRKHPFGQSFPFQKQG